MPDYSQGKIYRMVCDNPNMVYIGSTTQKLIRRFNNHKAWVNSGKASERLTNLFAAGNASIELLEEYPCDSKKVLELRERHFIETNECINYRIPRREDDERRQLRVERDRLYWAEHKEHQAQYKRDNKERANELKRIRYWKKKEEGLAKKNVE